MVVVLNQSIVFMHSYNAIWKITHFKEIFSECVNFGTKSMHFEKKIILRYDAMIRYQNTVKLNVIY